MKTRLQNLILSLSIINILGVTVAFAQVPERKVLFIGIDGLRSDALIQANTPVMDSLTNVGLYTFNSWHMGRTISGPSWTSMLTGVWDPKHGCQNNNYDGVDWNTYPYFTKRAKEVIPTLKCIQVITWNQFMPTTYPSGKIPTDFFDYSYDAGDYGQHAATNTVITQLMDPDVDVIFLHYDECDGTGHSQGFSPSIPSYMNAIQTVDSEIGEVLVALRNRPNYANEDWLILLTTDHGGIGYGHGGNSNTERQIWWIAAGPSVPHLEITGSDPGSYMINPGAIDTAVVRQTPVLTDIGVTALDFLLKGTGVDPETHPTWNLDGKSWLSDELTFIEEITENNLFEVYPNPNHGQFVTRLDNTNEDATYTITNIQGQTIQKGIMYGNTANQFDLSGIKNGIYFITTIQGGKSSTRRIILN